MGRWYRAAGTFQVSGSTSDREKSSEVSHKWGRAKAMTPKNVGIGLLYQTALIPKMRKVQKPRYLKTNYRNGDQRLQHRAPKNPHDRDSAKRAMC